MNIFKRIILWFKNMNKPMISYHPTWLRADEQLPQMFKEVLVIGQLKDETFFGKHIARRWTGWNNPERTERRKDWGWLTTSDRRVHDVKCWYPLPDTIYNGYYDELKRKGITK